MGYADKDYLSTQFKNFSKEVDKEFARKTDIPDETTDYEELTNLPKINEVELKGEKSLEDLGIQPAGEYALVTEAGYQLGLSISTTDYVMTLELKDKEGNILDTKTIDFPIESMVVNASYSAGQLTLSLQNGQTLEPIDISDIVSGLVKDKFTIAGIDMKDNITAEELKTALGVPTKVSDLPDAGDYLKVADVETTNIDFTGYFTEG